MKRVFSEPLESTPELFSEHLESQVAKKFVFISAVCPYPADNGKKVFIEGLLRYMIEKVGADNVSYVFIGHGSLDALDAFRKRYGLDVIHLGTIRAWEIIRNVLRSFFEKEPKSFQECVLFSKKIQSNLFTILKQNNPDVVVMDTLRIGQYFEYEKPFPAKYIHYMEDLFSVRYERMLDPGFDQRILNAAGNFINNIPSVFRGFLNSKFIERFLLTVELRRISRRESSIPPKFEINLLLNEDDVGKLRKTSPQAKVTKIPPLMKISPSNKRSWNGEPTFVFVGDLKVSENSISVETFIKDCIGPIKQKIPNFQLLIIGKGIPPSLQSLVNKFPANIKYMGFVDDIDNILSKCAAMLIPMLFGSGIRFKALDAFVRGLPVLATPLGVEGLGLENLGVCLISDRMEQMPDHVELLLDKHTNQVFSENGMKFFEERFSYDRVCRFYDSIFELR